MNSQWLDMTIKLPDTSKPCIIIGNGPSLKTVDSSRLEKYETFGSNRIYLKFTPTYYVSVNPLVISQFSEEINQVRSRMKFIRAEFTNEIENALPLFSSGLPHFSREPYKAIYEGHTVTYVSMQLAYWLGFRTILLVGVDHRFKYDGAPNQENLMTGDDPNHFHPDYFKGVLWNNPDLEQSEISYRMAKTVFDNEGIRVLNLGPDSDLEVFERDSIENWI